MGFTENDVRALCERFGVDFSEAQSWYDGYSFKQAVHIYNPKSIVDAMTEGEYASYWTNTFIWDTWPMMKRQDQCIFPMKIS